MINEDEFNKADTLYNQEKYAEAFQSFLYLSELGDSGAMTRVACMYASGEGVELNISNSIKWDMKAIKNGSISSIPNLGVTYWRLGEYDNAIEWFKKALNYGYDDAAIALAKIYLTRGVMHAREFLSVITTNGNAFNDDKEEAEKLIHMLDYISKLISYPYI